MGRGSSEADDIFYGAEIASIEEDPTYIKGQQKEDDDSFRLAKKIFDHLYVSNEELRRLESKGQEGTVLLSQEEGFYVAPLSDVSPEGEYLSLIIGVTEDEGPELDLCVYKAAEDEFSIDHYYETLYSGTSLHDLISEGKTWCYENRCAFISTREKLHYELEGFSNDFSWAIPN